MIATAAQAGTYTRICACGNEFKVGTRGGASTKRYCSDKCTKRAEVARQQRRVHRLADPAMEASCSNSPAQGCGIIMAAFVTRRMDAHERAHPALFASGRN